MRKVPTEWGWAAKAPKSPGTKRLITTKGQKNPWGLQLDPCQVIRLCLWSVKGQRAAEPASWSLSVILTHRKSSLLPSAASHPWCSAKEPQLLGDGAQAQKGGRARGSHRLGILKIQIEKIPVLSSAQAEFSTESHWVKWKGCISGRSWPASLTDNHTTSTEHRACEGRVLARVSH